MKTQEAKHTPCPVCREEHEPRGLHYDGFGVNSCGMYRTRLATLTTEAREAGLGPVFAAAPELLEACRECITEPGAHCLTAGTRDALFRRLEAINMIARAAIAKAEGK